MSLSHWYSEHYSIRAQRWILCSFVYSCFSPHALSQWGWCDHISPLLILQPRPASVAQQAAERWWSSSPDSSMTESFSCHIIRPHQTLLSLSHILCASLFLSHALSLSFAVSFFWPQGTFSHPQQTQSCPTERHITTKITPKWVVHAGFWQLNYGWNACHTLSLSLGWWWWSGDITLTKFRFFLDLKAYYPIKFCWKRFWLCWGLGCYFFPTH